MSSSSHKFYHVHDMDPQVLLDTYTGAFTDRKYLDELIIFPLKGIYKLLESGHIKGDTLIELSTGAYVFDLFPFCNYFHNFIILEFNKSSMKELQKWMNKEPGVLDWTHVSNLVAELEGCSVNWEEKEEDVRKRIKHILKCDFTNENPTGPVILRDADCVFSFHVLETISEDLDALHDNLKKISSMLKPGGCLLLVTAFNGTHFTVAEHTYHVLCYSEADLSAALQEAGFRVECLEMIESKIRNNVICYDHMILVNAVKNKW